MKETEAIAPRTPLSVVAILVLALLSAVAPLATDMYLPAFPLMMSELGTDATSVQMTLTSFLFGLAIGQLVIGPLSDRFGRRRLLLFGTAVAVVSGFLCATVTNIEMLIVLRAFQGLGGGAGVVIARAIISDRTDDAVAAARLFQVMMLIGGLAPVLAPIIGAGVVALTGWRAVFVVIAVLSTVAFLGVLRYLDETLPPESRSAGGLANLGRGIAGLVGNRAYVGYTLTVGFSFMVLFAYISASPFVFQEVLGLSPLAYSIAFALNAIGIAAVSATSAKVVGLISPSGLAAIGLAVMTTGAFATLLAVLSGAGAGFMLPAIFLTVAPLGLVFGNSSALAIAEAPHSAGTASAIIGALQFGFGAIASPLVGLAGEDSAVPMALVMVGATLPAIGSFLLASRRTATEATA